MARIHEHLLTAASGVSPRLLSALEANGPLPLRRRWNLPLEEVLCRAVAGQQLSVKAASTIWGRVLDAAGGREVAGFVERARPQRLRHCGLSASKMRAMREIAGAARRGELDAARLARLDTEERAERLTAIWGIGRWTADVMNIFYFGDKDVWPDGDLSARNALERLTSRRRKTARTAERFAPYRSYLAMHMWKHVDADPNG